MKHIQQEVTKETSEEDLRLLVKSLGQGELEKKFSAFVFDINAPGIRVLLTTLAHIYRAAMYYGISHILIQELHDLPTFFSDGRYAEILQRYLTLLILKQEEVTFSQALPEHKVLNGKNPDWTLRTHEGDEFYVEVSCISPLKVFEDLKSFCGGLSTNRIISSSSDALYFEVIFKDNPRKYDASAIEMGIIRAARNQEFPTRFSVDHAIVIVDLLTNRYKQDQVISDEISSQKFFKSFNFIGEQLKFTLATEIGLKSVQAKIDEKKKSNKLDLIGNAWLCIFVSHMLYDLEQDSEVLASLEKRIANSKWLKKLILAELYEGVDGNWDLRYLMIG